MSLFKIDPKGPVEYDLKRIDRQYIPKILDAIESLAKNLFLWNPKSWKDSESCYRLRVGDYRVIYQVDTDNKFVTIYHVRRRKDAYKK